MNRPSKREVALTLMRVAGYHTDQSTWTRLYVESRIAMDVAKDAYRTGAAQRRAGVRCDCNDCKAVRQ